MTTERLDAARLAIAAANPAMPLAEVESRAQALISHEATQTALAEFAQSARDADAADDAERDRRWRVFMGQEKASGPSSADLVKQLKEAEERGETVGW